MGGGISKAIFKNLKNSTIVPNNRIKEKFYKGVYMPTTDSTQELYYKLDEIGKLIKDLGKDSTSELNAQAEAIKTLGESIKSEIAASRPSGIFKKSYRLLKNVHLYRSLMVQEVLLDSNDEVVFYGDVLMRGHSLSNMSSGSARSNYAGFTRVALPRDTEFIEVYGGHNVFYALPKEGNYLYVWGVNNSGCAGSGNTANIPIPTKIELSFRPAKIVSGQSQVTGKQTTLILSEDGRIYGAGTNTSGELGIGNTINTSTFTQSPYLRDIVDISFASNGNYGYALAIDTDGNLWSWGYNASGNLGLNLTTNVTIPAKTTFNTQVIKVSTSIGANNSATSLILLEDKSIRGAGYNVECQLSQSNLSNSSVFVRILKQNGNDLTDIEDIYAASGSGTCFAIDTDGNLWSFGYGGYGFGDSRTGNSQMASIVLENIQSIVTSANANTRTFAKLKNSGSLVAFGFNTDGSLGIGNILNTRDFQLVYLPSNFKDYMLYAFGAEANLITLCGDEVYSCGAYLDGNINVATQTLQKQS